jgi:hypothetical protein
VGGILIAWIGVKLLVQGSPDEVAQAVHHPDPSRLPTVIVADLVMSTDNIMAVAGASKGDIVLLLIGLGLSIPSSSSPPRFCPTSWTAFPGSSCWVAIWARWPWRWS